MNKNIVHLIDNIFWNMGFKTKTLADKVVHIMLIIISTIHIISIFSIMHIILIISIILRTLIAQSVDNLGDQFRPVMRADGFHASVLHTQRAVQLIPTLLWEKAPSESQVESMPLLDA